MSSSSSRTVVPTADTNLSEDAAADRRFCCQYIISQLLKDGHNEIARQIALAEGIELDDIQPSDELYHLVSNALRSGHPSLRDLDLEMLINSTDASNNNGGNVSTNDLDDADLLADMEEFNEFQPTVNNNFTAPTRGQWANRGFRGTATRGRGGGGRRGRGRGSSATGRTAPKKPKSDKPSKRGRGTGAARASRRAGARRGGTSRKPAGWY